MYKNLPFLALLLLQSVCAQDVPAEAHVQLRGRLDSAMDNMQGVAQEVQAKAISYHKEQRELFGVDQMPEDRSLWFLDGTCSRIEEAFDDDVECTCTFYWYVLAYEWKCVSKKPITLVGIEAKVQYKGTLDFQLFQLRLDIVGEVCLVGGKYEGTDLLDICAGGSLCVGSNGAGICSCKASYGPLSCSCTPCTSGTGFALNCGIPLPEVCLPIPLVASMSPPPNAIPSITEAQEAPDGFN